MKNRAICKDNNLIDLKVMGEFTNQKYATKLLLCAKNAGITEIKVEKNNRKAIGLYFKNGFYIYGSNKALLFMKLRFPKK